MNPVTWFEIPINDFQRAKTFYEKVFEINISEQIMDKMTMGWFPREQEGTGCTGTLIKGESYVPSHAGTLVYFSVKDIEATLGKAKANGGKILFPKFSIGEHGFCGHFEDCEGNRVALHSTE